MNLKWTPAFVTFAVAIGFLFHNGLATLGHVDTCGGGGCIQADTSTAEDSGGQGGEDGGGDAGAACAVYPFTVGNFDGGLPDGAPVQQAWVWVSDGDSITAGLHVPASYSQVGAWMMGDGVAFWNVATPSITLESILQRETTTVAPIIAQYGQAVVTIMAGVNDLNQDEVDAGPGGAAQLVTWLSQYCGLVHSQGGKCVVLTMYPVNSFGNAAPSTLLMYRNAVLASWTGYADAMLDTWTLLPGVTIDDAGVPQALVPPWTLNDDEHASMDFNAKIAQALAPIVKSVAGL